MKDSILVRIRRVEQSLPVESSTVLTVRVDDARVWLALLTRRAAEPRPGPCRPCMSVPKEMPSRSMVHGVGQPSAELVTSVWTILYRLALGVHSTSPDRLCQAVQDVSLETKPLELLACVTSRP